MSRCLLILSLYIAATNARNNESPTLHVVAPVHAAITNASIEVMLNCFLAQTSRDWALTVVGDGYDARAAAVVGRRLRRRSSAVHHLLEEPIIVLLPSSLAHEWDVAM